MASRQRPLPSASAPASTGAVVDFRAEAARRRPEAAYGPERGFPFALLASGMAGGVALGVLAALAGLPGWAACVIGWFWALALVPLLPCAAGIGRRCRAAPPNDPAGRSAKILTLPLARDLAAWAADAEAEARRRPEAR